MEEVVAEDVKQEETLEGLSKEYSQKATVAGDLQYKIKCFTGDLEKLNHEMFEINKKAFELKQKAEQK